MSMLSVKHGIQSGDASGGSNNAPQQQQQKKKKADIAPMNPFLYDLALWLFSILVDLFFREVHPRGSWRIPRKGPVIFVAAPHANQFVDPLILMRVIRVEAHRRIAFLTAGKSMKRRFVGLLSRAAGAVPVERAQDLTKPGSGKIYLPDPVNDPTLVRGVDTKFDIEAQVKGLIVLSKVKGVSASVEIAEIHGPEELRLKKPFKGADAMRQLTGREDVNEDGTVPEGGVAPPDFKGTNYKVAPHVDQTEVYDAVFQRLNAGGCVGIFPEGGSHDRTELLPLKAGVAIMALGALAANPNSGLKIIPCGMNYFHAHKFRSRAVIEFGPPIEVPPELIDMYKRGERRESVGQLLDIIYQSLVTVTVTSPDYDTLMLIQPARRLYNPTGKKLPLPMIVELNRRLVKGYTEKKDDPRIVHLKNEVLAYNKQLWHLGIRDHQVEYAKLSPPKIIFTLFYRLAKLSVLAIATAPGTILFAPVFIAGKVISIKKSREALAASTVKIQARDVMATWKLLVAMALAPVLYAFYTFCLTYWTYRNRVQGYIPEWVPLWAVVIFGFIIFPAITFAALRFGEIGMDIIKSLRPLLLCLNPTSANTLVKLREKRAYLSQEVTDVINTFGPEVFPDFDAHRILSDPLREKSPIRHARRDSPFEDSLTPMSPSRHKGDPGRERDYFNAGPGDGPSHSGHLPRNDSLGNIGSIGLFSTRPPSRSRSRSSSSGGHPNSAGFPIQAFSKIDAKETLDVVAQKIRGAMRERGLQRQRRRSEDGWEIGSDGRSDGTSTPLYEEGKREI